MNTINQSTLRSRGFRIVKLTGNRTMLNNDRPFTVNGKPANYKPNSGEYRMILIGWFNGPIPRDIEVITC